MILSCIATTCYRMHTPRWAHAPTSGAGAAKHGGRLNRPGIKALYLSEDVETAVAEYQQTAAVLPPGLLVSYQVELATVVDFSDGFSTASWEPIWEDFFCDWRKLVLSGVEPPSWVIADIVLPSSAQGVRFPSTARPRGHQPRRLSGATCRR